MDVRKGIIPNWLTYSTLLVAVTLSLFDDGRQFTSTLIGFTISFFLPFFFFLIRRLGGGDVKLLAALGATLGFPIAIDLLLWTCIFGFLIALSMVIAAGRLKELAMDILEIILFTFQQKLGSTETPVSGLSTPLAVAIFMSVCWIIFFPDYARLTIL